jgi:hypothetical protein
VGPGVTQSRLDGLHQLSGSRLTGSELPLRLP